MPPACALPCSGSPCSAALAEVERLGVERRLGEAEDVRPVVHAVVHRVQVRARRVDVVQLRRRERGRVAARREPLVRPRVDVVARGRRRVVDALRGCRCSSSTSPSRGRCCRASGTSACSRAASTSQGAGEALFATAFWQPGRRRGEVPAPELARVGRRVVERRRGREDLPRRVVAPRGRRSRRGRAARRSRRRRSSSRRSARSATSISRTSYACRTPSVGVGTATSRARAGLGVALDVHHRPAVLGRGRSRSRPPAVRRPARRRGPRPPPRARRSR